MIGDVPGTANANVSAAVADGCETTYSTRDGNTGAGFALRGEPQFFATEVLRTFPESGVLAEVGASATEKTTQQRSE